MAEIRVQVCYAGPDCSLLREVVLPAGATLRSAIEHSGLLLDAPEINLATCRVGVYGKLKPLDTVLRERDRVEIYRSLIADPKESRRKRAQKKDAAVSR
jgi:putative ubiquitin-RnfH superfamily antitoxin RatB of RatAB toxin-antitoxin module